MRFFLWGHRTDEYDHLDSWPGSTMKQHYHRMDKALNITVEENEANESNFGMNNLNAPSSSSGMAGPSTSSTAATAVVASSAISPASSSSMSSSGSSKSSTASSPDDNVSRTSRGDGAGSSAKQLNWFVWLISSLTHIVAHYYHPYFIDFCMMHFVVVIINGECVIRYTNFFFISLWTSNIFAFIFNICKYEMFILIWLHSFSIVFDFVSFNQRVFLL